MQQLIQMIILIIHIKYHKYIHQVCAWYAVSLPLHYCSQDQSWLYQGRICLHSAIK